MHYHPLTNDEKKEMLETIGVDSVEDLLAVIPPQLRNPQIQMGPGSSELEVQKLLRAIAHQNNTVRDFISFLGAGSYEHFIPKAVAEITGRHEFYTAYTPYQPEASQGTLQAIYEFQSLITELTGMDVANASHYDGATSTAEAALLALRHTDRTTILVARSLHPHYREVLKTYLAGTPYRVCEVPFREDKSLDLEDLWEKMTPEVAGVIVQSPNFFGIVEDLNGVAERIHAAGGLLIQVGHPLAYGIYKTPGEWGADIACGEGQPLGIPLSFGGPYLGYFATTRALVRRIPGRLVGLTQDSEGRRAYCLTLQAREQHIRRERAASNICTNQALCALAACVYLTLLGKAGLREVAELNFDRAGYLREKIAGLAGYEVDTRAVIFNEFVVRASKPFSSIQEKMVQERILPGVGLEEYYPELKNEFLVCATETKSREDLDRLVEALAQC